MEAKRGVNNNSSSGIVQQCQSLWQTRLQMVKEIATLRIQKDTKLREVKGTFHFSISIILHTILYYYCHVSLTFIELNWCLDFVICDSRPFELI